MSHKRVHDQLLQLIDIQDLEILHPEYLLALQLSPTLWQKVAINAAKLNYRLATLWAQDLGEYFELNVVLELQASYLLFRTLISSDHPSITSFTPYFPAANRLERHTHDMFGINFINLADQRPWTKHQAWNENQFPLRKSFAVTTLPTTTTPPDNNYPFVPISGSGVCEIPVGPVHAGIIEPGHFRFHVAGEDILTLEEHLGYTHKGIEKIAEGRSVHELVKLAGRISGDCTVGHTLATCNALENATNLKIPDRALYLRAIMCERERVANHLGDFAAICNDVAYTFAYYQLTRLKELWLRLNEEIFKHRFIMDGVIPGGVAFDLDHESCQKMLKQILNFRLELNELIPIFEANSSLHDRIKTTGILSIEKAKLLGTLGYVGRASGQKLDLRHDLAYPPYNKLKIRVPVYEHGDVLARLRVRYQEILVTFDIIEQLIDILPNSIIHTPWISPKKSVEGIGFVESWRGEIITFVKLNSSDVVERYFPRDPSWFSWPALEQLVHGNIVPDFPVCNKSINGSYSGVDL